MDRVNDEKDRCEMRILLWTARPSPQPSPTGVGEGERFLAAAWSVGVAR